MNNIDLNNNDIVKFIMDKIESSKCRLLPVSDVKFHHNTSYKNAPLVLKHGILTLLDLNKLGLRNDSIELLERFSDVESHINGTDGVSLAKVGLQDLYEDEREYDPFDPCKVDFTLSSSVTAHRNSSHYGNEYICSKSIETDKILTADVRILEYIDKFKDKRNLIVMYNSLIEISKMIEDNALNVSLREMSYDNNFSFDTNRLASLEKIKLTSIK